MKLIIPALTVAIAFAIAGPAHAAKANANDKDLVRSVDLDGLVFPIFERRQLRNYVFVSARLRVAPGLDAWKYREKAHLIRDAIILVAHEKSLHAGDDVTKLDLIRAEAACLKAANAAIGENGALVEMIFTRVASKVGFIE